MSIENRKHPIETAGQSESENEPERKELAEVRQQRSKILMRVIQRKSMEVWAHPVVQKTINHLPMVGDAAMAYKLATGKEGGRQLTGKEKFLYSASILTSLAGMYYLAHGELTIAGVSSSMSEFFTHADSTRAFLKIAADKIKMVKPDLSQMFLAMSNFVSANLSHLGKLKDSFDISAIAETEIE